MLAGSSWRLARVGSLSSRSSCCCPSHPTPHEMLLRHSAPGKRQPWIEPVPSTRRMQSATVAAQPPAGSSTPPPMPPPQRAPKQQPSAGDKAALRAEAASPGVADEKEAEKKNMSQIDKLLLDLKQLRQREAEAGVSAEDDDDDEDLGEDWVWWRMEDSEAGQAEEAEGGSGGGAAEAGGGAAGQAGRRP